MSIKTADSVKSAFNAIENLAVKGSAITLTRPFKGIHLNQAVEILSVCQGYVVFRACDMRMFASPETQQVHLRNENLPWPVKARVQKMAVDQCTFILSDFAFQKGEWVERADERVQPKTPAYVWIRNGRRRAIGTLFDIHAHGAALLLREDLAQELRMAPMANADLTFQLQPSFNCKDLKARVMNLEPAAGSLIRVGVELHPNQRQAYQLETYIQRRKEEILSELDKAYLRVLEPRRVEDLYF